MSTLKMIKHDAIVKIEIGTGFLQKLQRVFIFLASELNAEQLELYKKVAETKKPEEDFPEEWMDQLTTISVLLKEIETKAEEQGFTYEEEIPEGETSTPEEN